LIVVVGEWFRLPRLGREVFVSLMKTGLVYDKARGFRAEADADLIKIASILKGVLEEDFEFVPRCFTCDSIIECYSCAYYQACGVKSLTQNCLCEECVNNRDALSVYRRALIKRIG
jgi:hypothetical protein